MSTGIEKAITDVGAMEATNETVIIADTLKHCSLPLLGNSKYMCYLCLEFVINAKKNKELHTVVQFAK